MIRIISEGQSIEVAAESLSVVYQVNEIGSLENRKVSHTNSFRVPRTPNNEAFFDRLGVFGNESNKPYEKTRVSLADNSNLLIEKGLISIESTHEDYYQIRIYDGTLGLKEILNKPLDELRSNEFQRMLWKQQNGYVTQDDFLVKDYIERKEGLIFIAKNFTTSSKPYADIEVPLGFDPNRDLSIFLSEIIRLMFLQSGLRYRSDFFESDYFKSWILPRYIVDDVGIDDYPQLFAGMSQYDFLAGICDMFGLVFSLEKDGAYRFERMNDIMNEAEDWSDKFVRKVSEKYSQGSYEEKNNFEYSYKDGDNHNRDWAIMVRNPFRLGGEKTFKKLPFIARPDGNSGFFKSVAWWTLGDILDNRTLMRVVFVDANVEIGNQGFAESMNIAVPTYNGVPAKDLIRDNFLTVAKTLNRGETVEVDFNLNELDINKLSFFKSKYIKQLGGNFFLQRIKGYKVGELSRCVMLRVNNTYNYDIDNIDLKDSSVIPTAKMIPSEEIKAGNQNVFFGVTNGIPSTDPQGLALTHTFTPLTADGVFKITNITNGGQRIEWELDVGTIAGIYQVEIQLEVENTDGYKDIAYYRCYIDRP